jgi:preprotein translocase subunit YajC
MRLTIGIATAIAIALAVPAAPAVAQAAGAITVGMPVTDASGGAVGTVAEIKGDNLVIKTDKHEVMLARKSFSVDQGKLLFGMTQAQLNAEIEKSMAAANAAIVVGATVKGTAGASIGKIDTVDADTVTLSLDSGKKLRMPKEGVRGNADGTVTVGYTAQQLDALVAGRARGVTSGQ